MNARRSVAWWSWLFVGLVSVVLMVVLALIPSTVHEVVHDADHPGYTTLCSSVVVAGWPRDLSTSDDRVAAAGILSTDTSEPPYNACNGRRSLFAAGIAVLAVPASSLVHLAMAGRRYPRDRS